MNLNSQPSTTSGGLSLVPLDRAEFSGEQVTAPDDKDKVAGAPTTMS